MEFNANVCFVMMFVLAHLIGDFVLQTNKIARIKAVSVKGVGYHIIIVLVVQMLFLGWFGIRGLLAAIIGAALHFGIDVIKLVTNKLFIKVQLLYFIFDQLLHISVICFLAILFKPELQINIDVILMEQIGGIIYSLIYAILYTYVISVMGKMLLRDIFEGLRKQQFFKKRERLIDAILCISLFLVFISLSIYVFVVATIIVGIAFYMLQVKRYYYSFKEVIIKYSFYLLLITLGGLFF